MELLRHLLQCCPPFGALTGQQRKHSPGASESEQDFVPLKRGAAAAAAAADADADNTANGRLNSNQSVSYGSTNAASAGVPASTDESASNLSRHSSTKSMDRRSDMSQQSAPADQQAVFPDKELGQLHFVVQYIGGKSTLYIRIIKGIGLTAQDSNGLSDPYVKIHLLPDAGKRTKLRTKTCQRTLNPIWDEEFCYSGVSAEDLQSKVLRLSVLDEDTIGFDWMGEIVLPLKHLAHCRKEYNEIFLQPRNLELEKSLTSQDTDRGKIQLGLYYAPAKCELTVHVMQCVNLIAMDPNGFSDPFVKLYLKPDKDKGSKFKTEVKKKTLNPEFHEEFVYHVTPQDLPRKTLEITVWDKDFGTKNDFIGALMLGNKCSGDRWSHWEQMLKQPYQRYNRWHSLQEELQPDDAK